MYSLFSCKSYCIKNLSFLIIDGTVMVLVLAHAFYFGEMSNRFVCMICVDACLSDY